MSSTYCILLCGLLSGWTLVSGEDNQNAVEGRHLSKHKCQFGSCGGSGSFGGYQGYQSGHQGGNQGYPYPPINIGISQSQASSSGGYGADYYSPFNQYNQYNGFPNSNYGSHGYGPYNKGYGPYNGNGPYNNGFGPYSNGYNRPFGGHNRPFGEYNNQFNGNYYLGNTGSGYGLVPSFDDDSENYDEGTSAKRAE